MDLDHETQLEAMYDLIDLLMDVARDYLRGEDGYDYQTWVIGRCIRLIRAFDGTLEKVVSVWLEDEVLLRHIPQEQSEQTLTVLKLLLSERQTKGETQAYYLPHFAS